MTQYLTWLADVLRSAGLGVREIPGWQTRGHGGFADRGVGGVLGVLCHHTAGPAAGLYPSEKVVVEGRPGLAGPLCNLGLDRAGTWIVVAAGQAWHAGSGSLPWCPAGQGNSRLIGVEAESTGTTAPNGDWTPAQRQSYPRGVAALLAHLQLSPSRAAGHKEWAPGRKIDPAFLDMDQFRADVAHWMTAPARPTATQQEEPMTPEDRAYFDQRFTDLWSLWNVRKDDRGVWRDRLTDLWDELRANHADVTALHAPGGPATLSDTDVQRIAAAVIALLGRKTSAP